MKIEIRSECVHISGYVNAVDRVSRIITDKKTGEKFVERMMPGTFRRAIDEAGTVLIKHNHENIVGSTADEGVKLYEDNIGLYCEADIYDSDVMERARNKELVGWSFGFILLECQRAETDVEGADYERKVTAIKLDEVSIIDKRKLPCYKATSIECRAFEEEETEYEEVPEEPETKKPDFSLKRKRLLLFMD